MRNSTASAIKGVKACEKDMEFSSNYKGSKFITKYYLFVDDHK
jgi:hypothetical protein